MQSNRSRRERNANGKSGKGEKETNEKKEKEGKGMPEYVAHSNNRLGRHVSRASLKQQMQSITFFIAQTI